MNKKAKRKRTWCERIEEEEVPLETEERVRGSMVEDCGGSVEVRDVREKEDREAATNEDEDVCGWIWLPNGALNDYSHQLFIISVWRSTKRECQKIYVPLESEVNPRSWFEHGRRRKVKLREAMDLIMRNGNALWRVASIYCWCWIADGEKKGEINRGPLPAEICFLKLQ